MCILVWSKLDVTLEVLYDFSFTKYPIKYRKKSLKTPLFAFQQKNTKHVKNKLNERFTLA